MLQKTRTLRLFKLPVERLHGVLHAPASPNPSRRFARMKGKFFFLKKRTKEFRCTGAPQGTATNAPVFMSLRQRSCEITQPPMHTKTPGVSTCTAPTATPMLKAASVSLNFWGRIDPVSTMTISLRRGSLAKKLPVSIIVSVPCVTTTRFVATSSDSTRASSARSSSVISVESFVHAVWYSTCMPSGT